MANLTALTSLDLSYNNIWADGTEALKGFTIARQPRVVRQPDRARWGAGAQRPHRRLQVSTCTATRSGPMGRRRSRALPRLPASCCPATASGPMGRRRSRASPGAHKPRPVRQPHRSRRGAGAQRSHRPYRLQLWGGNNIGAEGAQALTGLTDLTSLDLSHNNIRDISPLVSLRNLQKIQFVRIAASIMTCRHSGCSASLRDAILHDATLPGVPVEILSKEVWDNCLDRLRAHLADLSGDDEAVGDVKLMILGNGRVGKTQICRRLRGEGFDEAVPSTHGIQVSSVPLAPQIFDAPVTLKIWDFGGQDIYHGTHALFLKSRAIFPLVWTSEVGGGAIPHPWRLYLSQPAARLLADLYTHLRRRAVAGVRRPVAM